MTLFFYALGIVGMIVILITFIQDQRGKWHPNDRIFDWMNFIGASLLTAYAWNTASWPFAILNGAYALYSLKDIIFEKHTK